jgi:hypothetical protein
MKKIYGVAFLMFLLMSNQIGCVIKQKTAHEIAASLSAGLSPFMTKNAIAELMAQAKIQSAENGVDEKEVVQSLVWKVDDKLRYYKNSLLKPQNEFYDSDKILLLGAVGIILDSLLYYCATDSTENKERFYFLDPQDVRADTSIGGFFVSEHALKVFSKDAIKDPSDFLAGAVVSAAVLTWGAYLKIWEWYTEACCRKYSFIKSELEGYLYSVELMTLSDEPKLE